MTDDNTESKKILLIEDDEELAALIQEYLSGKGFTINIESSGKYAVERITQEQPDLVILDLMLPGKDGIVICREARFHYRRPILMLTASNDAMDHVLGLEIGADDYVQKPVEPRILLARIRALLRRVEAPSPPSQTKNPDILTFGKLNINRSACTVTIENEVLDLTTPEFDLLLFLADNAGQIISREALFKALRNLEYDGQNRFIDITMSHLRKKFRAHADTYLKTIRGKGYLFIL